MASHCYHKCGSCALEKNKFVSSLLLYIIITITIVVVIVAIIVVLLVLLLPLLIFVFLLYRVICEWCIDEIVIDDSI